MSDRIEAFNTVAGIYDDWYKHPQGKQVFRAERETLAKLIPEKGLGVEIGAGTGVFAESLTTDDRRILCIDPSVEMLRKAKGRSLPCILGVGEPLPIRIGLLDFSYMVTVIEFIDDPAALFKEILETMKQDASLSILFINSDSSWGDIYRKIGEKGDPVFQHARLYILDEVTKLLNQAGYCVEEAYGTLNSDPADQQIDGNMIEPSSKSGVIVLKAKNSSS